MVVLCRPRIMLCYFSSGANLPTPHPMSGRRRELLSEIHPGNIRNTTQEISEIPLKDGGRACGRRSTVWREKLLQDLLAEMQEILIGGRATRVLAIYWKLTCGEFSHIGYRIYNFLQLYHIVWLMIGCVISYCLRKGVTDSLS